MVSPQWSYNSRSPCKKHDRIKILKPPAMILNYEKVSLVKYRTHWQGVQLTMHTTGSSCRSQQVFVHAVQDCFASSCKNGKKWTNLWAESPYLNRKCFHSSGNTYKYSRFLSWPIDGDKVPLMPYAPNFLQNMNNRARVSGSVLLLSCRDRKETMSLWNTRCEHPTKLKSFAITY